MFEKRHTQKHRLQIESNCPKSANKMVLKANFLLKKIKFKSLIVIDLVG